MWRSEEEKNPCCTAEEKKNTRRSTERQRRRGKGRKRERERNACAFLVYRQLGATFLSSSLDPQRAEGSKTPSVPRGRQTANRRKTRKRRKKRKNAKETHFRGQKGGKTRLFCGRGFSFSEGLEVFDVQASSSLGLKKLKNLLSFADKPCVKSASLTRKKGRKEEAETL